jgi:membrane-bound lytic murein transglycosylase B
MLSALWGHRYAKRFGLAAALVMLGTATVAVAADTGTEPRGGTSDDPVAEASPSPVYVEHAEVLVARRVRLVSTAVAQRALGPKGTQLWRISSTSGHDVPVAAKRAYVAAARTMERTRPGCGIEWWLLAGIGRVESDHGRYGGSKLGTDGVSRPMIRGIALNGVGPVAAIPDSDDGRLDGDKVWDRAVGPMQFIPTTWAGMGSPDGDGDGVSTPNDIDDAALAAAMYLCGSSSLRSESGMRAAVFRYNHSDYYVDLVMAFARGYQTGVFNLPEPPMVEVEAEPVKKVQAKVRVRKAVAVRDSDRDRSGSGTRSGTEQTATKATGTKSQAPAPATQTKTATPKPTQTQTAAPEPPPPCCTGTLAGGGDTWTVGGTPVDFGMLDDAKRARLEELRDTSVTVVVDEANLVLELNGSDW